MNPHSKGGHAAALGRSGNKCSVAGCPNTIHSREWCSAHYSRWYRHGDAIAGKPLRDAPAAPAPPFPRRTIVADYCRECGRTSGCWQGCGGGERVAPENRHLPAGTGRLTPDKSEPRSTVLGGPVGRVLEQLGLPHE